MKMLIENTSDIGGATSDPRKGYKELSGALRYISKEYELVVLGANKPVSVQIFAPKAHYLK